MIDLTNRHVIFCGDIHGAFRELVFTLKDKKIKDTDIIICGDCGIGFEKPKYYTETLYGRIHKPLLSLNDRIYCIRGNHDDPDYFNGSNKIDLDILKTIEDYEIIKTDKGTILCIGGASSVDRDIRKDYDSKHPGKYTWWAGERPTKKDLSELPSNIDCILSHDGPIQIGPVVSRPSDMSLELYQNIIKDRDYLGEVLKEVEPSNWVFGHHHEYQSGTWGKTMWRCLGIMNLFEYV